MFLLRLCRERRFIEHEIFIIMYMIIVIFCLRSLHSLNFSHGYVSVSRPESIAEEFSGLLLIKTKMSDMLETTLMS